MKKLNRILLTATALFAFFPTLFAQGLNGNPHGGIGADGNPRSYQENDLGIAYSKDITGPKNGLYTIHLHTFVTGEGTVTHSKRAADIVLVLDVSGSMNGNMTVYPYSERTSTSYSYDSFGYYPTYYCLYNGQYYEVSRGYSGNYYNRRYYLRFQTKGGEYKYLSGTSVVNDQPTNVSESDDPIWEGVLYTRGSGQTRKKIDELKSAVKTFIQQIKENDVDSEGNPLGNQISIVKFAGNNYYDGSETSAAETGNHKYSESESYSGDWIVYGETNFDRTDRYNTTEIVKGFTGLDEAGFAALNTAVDQLTPGGGTAADHGMKKALALINTLYDKDEDGKLIPKRQSNKTVVFFTDGDPGQYGDWETESTNCAINTISTAKEIKSKLAYTDTKVTPKKDYNVTVFSVSVFSATNNYQTRNNRNTYMNRTSSNYPNASGMGTNQGGADSQPSGIYYQDASAGNLEDVFRMIANESGGNSSLNNTTITAVDVVSNSFNIPDGASNIHFYEAKVQSVASDGTITFEPKSSWTSDPSGVSVLPDSQDPHKVVATGFDYAANYCGIITVDGVPKPHGSKLVVEIEITMDDNAVGGPLTDTNGPGSGIYLDGVNKLIFDSPKVDLPVNLQIKKVNMQFGESSKFKIQRSLARVDENTYNPKPSASTTWDDVTSVFVTKTSKTEEPDVYIRGLDPNYYYRILEENWGWSYDFVSASGPAYVPDVDDEDEDGDTEELVKGTKIITNKNEVTADKFIGNPIVFDNKKKDNIESNVHHAESKAKNIFRTATESNPNIEYLDSKKGNGTGRITP